MNHSKITPVLLALVCITAIGVSATTLETSLGTDPEDEINPSYEYLPIGQEDALALQQEIEGDNDDSTDGSSNSQQSEMGSEGDPVTGGGDADNGQDGDNLGVGETAPSLLNQLLALLWALLRILLVLAVIGTIGYVAARYRERLLALFGFLPEDDAAPAGRAVGEWPSTRPTSVVDRAWLALVREGNPARPAVMTPSECAAAAVNAGVDSEAAEAITDAFERVHYGGTSVSAVKDQATAGWRQLRGGETPTTGPATSRFDDDGGAS